MTAAQSSMCEFAPRVLSGDDGEVYFVRRDLAATPTKARAVALAFDGTNLGGMEPDEVEMLPVPEHFTVIVEDLGYSWSIVREGTPDAVSYWRFRL